MSRLLTLVLALVPLTGEAQNVGEARRTVRVVMDNAYAPYVFQSADGKLQGILIDQWQAWEKKTGIVAEIHSIDWDEAQRRMRAGEFDVIDCIVETPERRNYCDFTPPYTTVEASIYFRNDISGITDLPSLRGFPVGVKAGDQHIDKLKASGATSVLLYNNNEAIIQAAKEHRINVFVVDDPSALYLLNKMGIDGDFRHSAPVFRDELRRGVRKGDAALMRTVSEGFAAIEPGELKQIDEKWFGRTINRYEPYLTYAGEAAAVAILLIAGLVGWNRSLRKQILQRTAALGESEERFRQIAENIHEVFWLTTFDSSKTLYISPAYETVWGRSRDSLYQDPRSFIAAIHPEDHRRLFDLTEKDRERGFEVEYRLVRPDGSVRWIRDRGFPIRDDAGQVYRLAGLAEDITERKLAVEAVKKAEDNLRLVLDATPALIHTGRPDGYLDYFNERWLEYVGRSLEDLLGWAWTAAIHPEDVEGMLNRWRASLASGEAFQYESRVRRANGEYRWMLHHKVPQRDEHGNIVKWHGSSIDIEDRKRAEEKLTQSERRLAEAQRVAHVGYWERDLASGAITWSDETYRIFGLHAPAAIERFQEMIHPEDRALQVEATGRLLDGLDYDVEYRVVRPDGEIRLVHSQGHAIRDESGRQHRVFGTAQDVTELRRAEEKLKATSEQLRALSARVQSAREEEGIRIAREIHDELGSALTSLKWDLEVIRKSISEPGKRPHLPDLTEKLTGMLGLTDATLNIVRRIASELRPSVLDILGLKEAIEWQARQFQDRTGIAVYCDGPAGDVALTKEQATAFFRIFQEALTNIIRHAEATRVYVTMAGEPGAFVLSIRDNGRGITEDEKSGQLSIGILGMRERAHLSGGTFDITAVGGEGTTVTVRLPMVPAEDAVESRR